MTTQKEQKMSPYERFTSLDHGILEMKPEEGFEYGGFDLKCTKSDNDSFSFTSKFPGGNEVNFKIYPKTRKLFIASLDIGIAKVSVSPKADERAKIIA